MVDTVGTFAGGLGEARMILATFAIARPDLLQDESHISLRPLLGEADIAIADGEFRDDAVAH